MAQRKGPQSATVALLGGLNQPLKLEPQSAPEVPVIHDSEEELDAGMDAVVAQLGTALNDAGRYAVVVATSDSSEEAGPIDDEVVELLPELDAQTVEARLREKFEEIFSFVFEIPVDELLQPPKKEEKRSLLSWLSRRPKQPQPSTEMTTEAAEKKARMKDLFIEGVMFELSLGEGYRLVTAFKGMAGVCPKLSPLLPKNEMQWGKFISQVMAHINNHILR